MVRLFVTAIVLITTSVLVPGRTGAGNIPGAPAGKHIDIRVKQFPDLFFSSVLLTSGSENLPKIEGFSQVVEAAKPMQEIIRAGLPGPFFIVAAQVVDCDRASDAVQAFAKLPESVQTRSGDTIKIRDAAVTFAKALAAVEDAYYKQVWPQRKATIDKAAASADKLISKEAECFAYITKSLGIEDKPGNIPVFLVVDAPRPGGFTSRSANGGGGCLISVSAVQDSLLFETMLHESIHFLDIESSGGSNVLVEIRKRLMDAGLKETDPDLRNVPHTLMFIQAGETIRRIVDPSHKHYGEAKGYYSRVPAISKLELPIWAAHLDGKISRDEAIKQIVDGFLKTRAN